MILTTVLGFAATLAGALWWSHDRRRLRALEASVTKLMGELAVERRKALTLMLERNAATAFAQEWENAAEHWMAKTHERDEQLERERLAGQRAAHDPTTPQGAARAYRIRMRSHDVAVRSSDERVQYTHAELARQVLWESLRSTMRRRSWSPSNDPPSNNATMYVGGVESSELRGLNGSMVICDDVDGAAEGDGAQALDGRDGLRQSPASKEPRLPVGPPASDVTYPSSGDPLQPATGNPTFVGMDLGSGPSETSYFPRDWFDQR